MFDHGVDGGVGVGRRDGGAMVGGMMAEVVGGVEREDALVAFYEEEPFEEAAALVVEKIFVPAAFGEFGDDDDDAAVRLLGGKLKNVLNDGNDDKAIRRRKADEFWRRIAGGFERFDDEAIPFFGEDFGVFVGLDVNRDDFRSQPRREFEPMPGNLAVVIDGDNGNGLR